MKNMNWQVDWIKYAGRVTFVAEDQQVHHGEVVKTVAQSGEFRMLIRFDEPINPRGMEPGAWLQHEWNIHPRWVRPSWEA